MIFRLQHSIPIGDMCDIAQPAGAAPARVLTLADASRTNAFRGAEAMIETICRAIDEKGHLTTAAAHLSADADLYAAGLTPFAAIQVMLELERRLDIEFPKSMLNRRSMATIDAITSLLLALQTQAAHSRAA